MFVADGGKSVQALLDITDEPIRPEMQMYADAKELGVYDMWKLHLERTELQRQYLEQWNSIEGLDAIIGKSEICVICTHSLTVASTHDSLLQRTAW
jgi:amidase